MHFAMIALPTSLRRHNGSDGHDFHADLGNLVERYGTRGGLGSVEQSKVYPLAHRTAIDDTIIADFLNKL